MMSLIISDPGSRGSGGEAESGGGGAVIEGGWQCSLRQGGCHAGSAAAPGDPVLNGRDSQLLVFLCKIRKGGDPSSEGLNPAGTRFFSSRGWRFRVRTESRDTLGCKETWAAQPVDKFVKKQRCSRGFLSHPDPADTRWTHKPVLPMYVCYRCLIKRPNVVFRLQLVLTPRLIRSLEVILPRSIMGSGIWNLAGEPPAKTKDLDSHAFDFKHIIYSFHLICLSVAAHSRLSIPPCHAIWQVSPGDERRGDNGLTTENWGARDANKI